MTPVFKSTYSYGKSILTLDDESKELGSDSLIEMCVDNEIKDVVLVEDNLTSFMKAFKACQKNKLNLYYGLRVTFCNDMSDESKSSDHKNIIFAKDDEGCKLLNKIYSCAFTEGGGRIDYATFKNYWDETSLSFVVPFYDSYIYENNFHQKNCIPDLDGLNPVFWSESNDLPFDHILNYKLQESTKRKGYRVAKVKTILYKDKKDVEALQTYKILCTRSFGKQSKLSSPNLSHFGSEEFCLESYLKQS
jgi:DNA polymerase III alpha subunit